MVQTREITQFSRLEWEILNSSGRFNAPPPENPDAPGHVREKAMRMFLALVNDPKSTINTTLGGIKNISTIRVYMVNDTMQLFFTPIKPLGMLEEEKKKAEVAAAKLKKTPVKSKRTGKPTDLKKKDGLKRRRHRLDYDDGRPFKPAELTGKTVPVERVTLPKRHH